MPFTKEQANLRLERINSPQELRDLIKQLDVRGSGSTTLLWSGSAGLNGNNLDERIAAEKIALSLHSENPNIRIVANTEASKFLNLDRSSENFNRQLAAKLESLFASDPDRIEEFLYGAVDKRTHKRLSKGIWDDVSENFVKLASGDVRLIVGGGGQDRVFAQTELPALLQNPAVTSIEGVPKDSLNTLAKTSGIQSVTRLLMGLSEVNTGMIRIRVDQNGRPISGVAGTYKIDATDYMRMSQSSSPIPLGMRAMVDYIPRERQLRHIQAIDDIRRVNLSLRKNGYLSPKQLDPYHVPGVLGRISSYAGVAGDTFSVSTMVIKSTSEMSRGDYEGARYTVSSWVCETTGSFIAGRLATAVVAPLMMTGPVGFLVGAGIIITASIAGGELGKKLLKDQQKRIIEIVEIIEIIASPLVLDLDGNGIQTLSMTSNYLHFDFDNNSFAERTGWVGPNDGLLILDLNANGKVDSGAELFGNSTVLRDGQVAPDGFAALAMYDLNNDQCIDSRDPIWDRLRVWRDRNSNAETDPGEWLTLTDLQIKSLYLSNFPDKKIDNQGNYHIQHGIYERMDGRIAEMTDVWFKKDATYGLPLITREVDEGTAALPNVPGMGIVPSLHQAMMDPNHPTLKAKLLEWLAATREQRMVLIEELLFEWCNASQNPFARPNRVYGSLDPLIAQKVAVIEKLFGEGLRNSEEVVADNRSAAVLAYFRDICLDFDMLLNVDTAIKPLFQLAVPVEGDQFGPLQLDLTESLQHMRSQFVRDPDPAYIPMIQWQLLHHEAPGQTFFQALQTLAASTADAMQRALRLQNMHTAPWKWQRGTAESDDLTGTANDDFIEGGRSVDVLRGGLGNDTLHGGPGLDSYYGGLGGDTYLVSQNADGEFDNVIDEGSALGGQVDRVIFWDRASNQVQPILERDKIVFYSLKNGYLDANPFMREPVAFIAKQMEAQHRIEEFHFSDGVVWTHQTLLQQLPINGTEGPDKLNGSYQQSNRLYGLGGNDLLFGGIRNDQLEGQNGHDRLAGFSGDDIIIGGPGNDTLEAGAGSDTYIFSSNFGHDNIIDISRAADEVDKIIFSDLSRRDLTSVVRKDMGLRLSFGSSSSIQLQYQLYPQCRIESFVFADGAVWNHDNLMQLLR
jgi:hypothetical protein